MSVAASTSKGKGDVKTQVAFTEQGGVCMSASLQPYITMLFSVLYNGVQYQ